MNSQSVHHILKHYHSSIDHDPHYTTPLFTVLYGSQNYNLDTPISDVDCYTILPLKNELFDKTISRTLETHTGNISVKDYRTFTHTLFKQNPCYLETLYTPHIIITPFYTSIIQEYFTIAKNIPSINPRRAIQSILGTLHNRLKNMIKNYERLQDFKKTSREQELEKIVRSITKDAYKIHYYHYLLTTVYIKQESTLENALTMNNERATRLKQIKTHATLDKTIDDYYHEAYALAQETENKEKIRKIIHQHPLEDTLAKQELQEQLNLNYLKILKTMGHENKHSLLL